MPGLTELLQITDVLVVGTLGNPNSYLSDDKTEVLTDYALTDQAILFEAKPRLSGKPSAPRAVTITQKGGTVVVDGVSFTERQPALEPLKPGSRVLCLLEAVGNKTMIAGSFFGVFSVEAGRLNPLMARPDFAREYRGAEYGSAVDSMLRVLRARRP
jgi:hypothetical protein